MGMGRSSDDSDGGISAYLYPPKSGSAYFTPHFILGGERFETSQPEMYLFGENMDLNFLGGKPAPFPYSAPLPSEPTRTLRSLINIRKESLRFVKVTNPNYIPIVKMVDVPESSCDEQKSNQNNQPVTNSDGIIVINENIESHHPSLKSSKRHLLKKSKSASNGQNGSQQPTGQQPAPVGSAAAAAAILDMSSTSTSGSQPVSASLSGVGTSSETCSSSATVINNPIVTQGTAGTTESSVAPGPGGSTVLNMMSQATLNTIHQPHHYNIEFIFDSDVKTAITIYYFALEEITPSGVFYTSKIPVICSETIVFKKGANQLFSAENHVFSPFVYSEDDLIYRAFDENGYFDPKVPFPVVIQAVALEGQDPKQSHSLIAVVERNSCGSYSIKPFIQKMFIDGLYYLLQEIYGIENKTISSHKSSDQYISPDDDFEDNGSECVVCLSDSRDTLILPCRHLCLCNACADSLRYQANNCPICRAPFRALLQLKAVRKIQTQPVLTASSVNMALMSNLTQNNPNATVGSSSVTTQTHHHHSHHHHSTHHTTTIDNQHATQQSTLGSQNNQMLSGSMTDMIDVPPGYESYPLIEALNGPNAVNHPTSTHGMYTFRTASDDANRIMTPVISGRRSHHRIMRSGHERHRSIPQHDSDVTDADDGLDGLQAAVPLRRAATSTPEVIVTGRLELEPPEKSSCLSMDESADVKWKVPNRSNARKTSLVDDHESTSSGGSSVVAQETTRLLEKDSSEPVTKILMSGCVRKRSVDSDSDNPSGNRCMSPSHKSASSSSRKSSAGHNHHHNNSHKSPSSKSSSSSIIRNRSCSPKNSSKDNVASPVSVGVASTGSYAIISLRDGMDEQKCMGTDDELSSTGAASSSSPVIRIRSDVNDDADDDNESNKLFVDASSSFSEPQYVS